MCYCAIIDLADLIDITVPSISTKLCCSRHAHGYKYPNNVHVFGEIKFCKNNFHIFSYIQKQINYKQVDSSLFKNQAVIG